MIAFAPLYGADELATRRLACAGGGIVQVYAIDDDEGPDAPRVSLELTLTVDGAREIHDLIWSDETSSRELIVASGPSVGSTATEDEKFHRIHVVPIESLVFPANCLDAAHDLQAVGRSLEKHTSRVARLVVSHVYLASASCSGECRVWQKRNDYTKKTRATLHSEGIADISIDRFFLHSVGMIDLTIATWTLPDLMPALKIVAHLPKELVVASCLEHLERLAPSPVIKCGPQAGDPAEPTPSIASEALPSQFERLTAVRRPQSRWAGSRGKEPSGAVYVAGVLKETMPHAPFAGAGVLTEWLLGEKVLCQSVRIAHETPIVTLAYGPYDNGPLVTCDAYGEFCIWDITHRLECIQHIYLGIVGDVRQLRMNVAVEPQKGLYTISGDSTLFVWRRDLRAVVLPVERA